VISLLKKVLFLITTMYKVIDIKVQTKGSYISPDVDRKSNNYKNDLLLDDSLSCFPNLREIIDKHDYSLRILCDIADEFPRLFPELVEMLYHR
jgi:hypothetical protein